jgi:hypothetical protein
VHCRTFSIRELSRRLAVDSNGYTHLNEL